MYSGVAPSASAWSTAAPASRSSRAHSRWPSWHAMIQRGSAAASRRPDARAALEQQPHRLGLPVTSGPGEQRVLLLGVVPRVELGRERRAARPPPGEEGAQPGQVAPSQVGEAGWEWRRSCRQKEEKILHSLSAKRSKGARRHPARFVRFRSPGPGCEAKMMLVSQEVFGRTSGGVARSARRHRRRVGVAAATRVVPRGSPEPLPAPRRPPSTPRAGP